MGTPATLNWQSMDTYKRGQKVLFWVNTGYDEFPVYGFIDVDGQIWDENGAGYGEEKYAASWAEFEPPQLHLH